MEENKLMTFRIQRFPASDIRKLEKIAAESGYKSAQELVREAMINIIAENMMISTSERLELEERYIGIAQQLSEISLKQDLLLMREERNDEFE